MKLPSISLLYTEAMKTAKRFPLVIISGFLIAILGITIIEDPQLSPKEFENLAKILTTLIFVLPLFASSRILSEFNKYDKKTATLLFISTILLGLGFYFLIPAQENSPEYQVMRMVILLAAAFFTISLASFVKSKPENDFWKYLANLVKNFVLTIFFAIVLFGGTALIIFSINELFTANIPDKTYVEFWIVIASIFSPWVFLTGISTESTKKISAPNLLKSFGQFILLPLLSVYTIVLYAYMAKILVSAEWPQGIVSGLVIAYAIAGILTHILLYAYQKENDWIAKFIKIFYILLVPLSGMLFGAIYQRISQYGITESRYYVVLFGIWLALIALYFIFSKNKRISLIPKSLLIIALLSLVGPWSSFSISANSQAKRLEAALAKSPEEVIKSDVLSIIYYLNDRHGLESFPASAKEKFPSEIEKLSRWERENAIISALKIERDPSHIINNHEYFYAETKNFLEIEGYKYLLNLNLININPTTNSISHLKGPEGLKAELKNSTLIITGTPIPLTFDLKALHRNLKLNFFSSENIAQENMTLENENESLKAKLILISLLVKDNEITSIEGGLLLTPKE